jgi:hypothetical protein
MLEAKIVEFRIVRCNDESRAAQGKSACKSKGEIDEYIRDIEIETWSIYQSIDFLEYGKLPVHNNMDLIRINVLDTMYSLVDNLSLNYHYVNTKDDYFQLGQYSWIGDFYQVRKVLS